MQGLLVSLENVGLQSGAWGKCTVFCWLQSFAIFCIPFSGRKIYIECNFAYLFYFFFFCADE